MNKEARTPADVVITIPSAQLQLGEGVMGTANFRVKMVDQPGEPLKVISWSYDIISQESAVDDPKAVADEPPDIAAFRLDVAPFPSPSPAPPKWAEVIFIALKPAAAEAILGDLNERFVDDCERLGPARARRHYRARVLRSLLPLVRRALGRALKWGALIAAVRKALGA